jgi:hypothetical protein
MNDQCGERQALERVRPKADESCFFGFSVLFLGDSYTKATAQRTCEAGMRGFAKRNLWCKLCRAHPEARRIEPGRAHVLAIGLSLCLRNAYSYRHFLTFRLVLVMEPRWILSMRIERSADSATTTRQNPATVAKPTKPRFLSNDATVPDKHTGEVNHPVGG